VFCTGQPYTRTFFSRTVPTSGYEEGITSRVTKHDNGEVSGAAASAENDALEPSRNSTAAGNSTSVRSFSRGGQSKRSPREGRGRGNWQQRNGYRRPGGQPPSTSAEQPASDSVRKAQHNSDGNFPPSLSDAVGKTQQNSAGNSRPSSSDAVAETRHISNGNMPPSSLEITVSSSEIPVSSSALPQRNRQRQTNAKDQPPSSTVNSPPTVESTST